MWGLCEVEGMFGVVGKVVGTLLYSRHTLLSLQILLLFHEQRVMQFFIFYKLITVYFIRERWVQIYNDSNLPQ